MTAEVPLPPGKLSEHDLRRILAHIGRADPAVFIGPAFGEDAAVVRLNHEQCLVIASDPITFAAEKIGWYAVHINANDIAAIGADPRWIVVVLLLPEGAQKGLPAEIMEQASAAAEKLGLTIVGGHTEVTPGLNRPIVVGTAAGIAHISDLRPSSSARPGDTLVLCGYACIEGTALLALEHETQARRILSDRGWKKAAGLLYEPGISIVRAARLARSHPGVHAMHDPTEGGVVNGAYEMAAASGLGVRLEADNIPLLPETRKLCEALHVDPLRALASGSLLIAVATEEATALLDFLQAEGLIARAVGQFTEQKDYVLVQRGLVYPLQANTHDEITRIKPE